MTSRAFRCGYQDAIEWDLSGETARSALGWPVGGWSEATLNAMGLTWCRADWRPSSWWKATRDYEAGIRGGLRARILLEK